MRSASFGGVKPYVLRYWEQEFTQLKPMKRRGNRRYYQHHEVLLIRRIRELLYEQGFTISGARNRLTDPLNPRGGRADAAAGLAANGTTPAQIVTGEPVTELPHDGIDGAEAGGHAVIDAALTLSAAQVRQELISIRGLLAP